MKINTDLIKFESGINLESGTKLESFELMVGTYGELNADKTNGILV